MFPLLSKEILLSMFEKYVNLISVIFPAKFWEIEILQAPFIRNVSSLNDYLR